MKKEEKIEKAINISIKPANVFVNVTISDAEGKLITDFNLSPFDALSIANSITDASVFARVEGMLIDLRKERKTK